MMSWKAIIMRERKMKWPYYWIIKQSINLNVIYIFEKKLPLKKKLRGEDQTNIG